MTLIHLIILLFCATIFSVLFFFFKRLKANQDEIKALISERFPAEEIVLQNPWAYCMGHKSKRVQKQGNGPLILTENELFFALSFPRVIISIPLSSITKVEQTRRFQAKGLLKMLIRVDFITDDSQEDAMAWYVKDTDSWMQALQKRIG